MGKQKDKNFKSFADHWANWLEIQVDVMKRAVEYKFGQNPDIRQKLLETGNAHLVEDSPYDKFWGGRLKDSKNMLGKVLMEYRNQ